MSISPGTADLSLYRGRTWKERISVLEPGTTTARNLTGYGVRMHVRSSIDQEEILLSITTTNTRASLEAPATLGIILIEVSAEDTKLFPENGHKVATYVYDIEIYEIGSAPEYVEPLLTGIVTVNPGVTRV